MSARGPCEPHPSRVSAWADGIIEAGWLTALIVAPLFVNPYGVRPFELGKVSLIRILALIVVSAWVIRWLEGGRRAGGNPLMLPALALIGAAGASTLASVSPIVSLFGSWDRSQGLYSTLAYVAIALVATGTIRSERQIERALTIMLVTSLPVSLYAMVQRYGLDPMRWPSTAPGDGPVLASTLGNPIFLGAYLLMIVPLALGRVGQATSGVARALEPRSSRRLLGIAVAASCVVPVAVWVLGAGVEPRSSGSGLRHLAAPEIFAVAHRNFHVALGVSVAVIAGWCFAGLRARDSTPFWQVGTYTQVLGLHVACILLAGRRGPFLGLIAAMLTFALLHAVVRGMRTTVLVAAAGGIAVLIGLTTASLIADPAPDRTRNAAPLARLLRVFDIQEGSGRVRILIWDGTLQLALPRPPLWAPSVGEDPLHPLRPLLGYGPESLAMVYPQVYQPELAQLDDPRARVDRAHGELFQAWVTTGLLGAVAYLGLFTWLLLFALRRLALVGGRAERRRFLAWWLGTGIAASLLAGVSLGWHLLGVILPGGMVLGAALYVIRRAPSGVGAPGSADALVVMLTAGLVGHFIEAQVGIAVTATLTYSWAFAATLVITGTGPASAPTAPASPASPWKVSQTFLALLASLMLVILAFAFIQTDRTASGVVIRAVDVIQSSLTWTTTVDGPRRSWAMLWVFVAPVALALALGDDMARGQHGGSRGERLVRLATIVAILIAIPLAFVAAQTHALAGNAGGELERLESLVPRFVVVVLGLVLLAGGVLGHERPSPTRLARTVTIPASLAIALLTAALVVKTNVGMVQADVLYRHAAMSAGAPGADRQLELLRRALALQPPQDRALTLLAHAEITLARSDPARPEDRLRRAEDLLLEARRMNPFEPERTEQLAALHETWATLLASPAARRQHLRTSLGHYADALKLGPGMPDIARHHRRVLEKYTALRNPPRDPSPERR